MFDQLLAGGGASLLNLIIHAVLLALVVRTVRGLSTRDSIDSPVLLNSIVIVATGTLLMAGHFLEVMVWADDLRAGRRRAARRRPRSISPSAITRRSAMATCCPSRIGGCSPR